MHLKDDGTLFVLFNNEEKENNSARCIELMWEIYSLNSYYKNALTINCTPSKKLKKILWIREEIDALVNKMNTTQGDIEQIIKSIRKGKISAIKIVVKGLVMNLNLIDDFDKALTALLLQKIA